jgi:hypothetical protein
MLVFTAEFSNDSISALAFVTATLSKFVKKPVRSKVTVVAAAFQILFKTTKVRRRHHLLGQVALIA